MINAPVQLSQSGFPVLTGAGALAAFGDWLSPSLIERGVILCDTVTFEKCLPLLYAAVPAVTSWPVITVPAGEEAKILSVASRIWNRLTEMNINRSHLLLNLGGGALTDLGGFVASTYLRGIPHVNVPTTLLGMVDAALGGKTAIDLGPVKNRIGTFVFPVCTVSDPVFLDTLPAEAWLDGLAESLKHAIIGDRELWKSLSDSRNVREAMIRYLPEIQSVKLRVVEADPMEKGLRKVLNFGHSIGHAIESCAMESGMQGISHGRAVAMGMVMEVRIAELLGMLEHDEGAQIRELIQKYFGKPILNWIHTDRFFHFLSLDKKNTNEGIFMALPDRIGSCNPAVEVKEGIVRTVLAETISGS